MRVLANSVQKSGTHLLLRLLELLGHPRFPRWRLDPEWTLERSLGKRLAMCPPGTRDRVGLGRGVDVGTRWLTRLVRRMPEDAALLGHAGFDDDLADMLARLDVRTICIVRDPRDVAVSHAHFLTRIGKDKILRKPAHQALLALPDHGARMLALLRGHPGTPSVAERFAEFRGWLDRSETHTVRFEDLVGAAGGGSSADQARAITEVARFLGRDAGTAEVERVRGSLFGGTTTFRKGTTGQWRTEFGPAHRAAAEETLAELLPLFGYPPN